MKPHFYLTALFCGLFLMLTGCRDQAEEPQTAEATQPVNAPVESDAASPIMETDPETMSQKEMDQAYVDAVRSLPPKVDTEAEVTAAQAAIGAFASALKAELTSAMQDGGPLNAMEVCNTRALAIREQVSASEGLLLSRVSLKNRNPGNAPLDWQRPVLETFDQFGQIGMDPNALDWSTVATVDGNPQFRYMKAIPTGGMCLMCHGQNIAPEVSEKLAELYPEDRATGYSEGEIRGAFVVVKDL